MAWSRVTLKREASMGEMDSHIPQKLSVLGSLLEPREPWYLEKTYLSTCTDHYSSCPTPATCGTMASTTLVSCVPMESRLAWMRTLSCFHGVWMKDPVIPNRVLVVIPLSGY